MTKSDLVQKVAEKLKLSNGRSESRQDRPRKGEAMELEHGVTDALTATTELLAAGEPCVPPDACYLCGGSLLVIHLALRYGSRRGSATRRRPGTSVSLCLECVEDVANLHEEHRSEWVQRWNDTIDKAHAVHRR